MRHGVSLTWLTTYLRWLGTFDISRCTSTVALDLLDQTTKPFIYPLNNGSCIPKELLQYLEGFKDVDEQINGAALGDCSNTIVD